MISGRRFLSPAALRRRPVTGTRSISARMSASGWASHAGGKAARRSRTMSDLEMRRACDSCSIWFARTSGNRMVNVFMSDTVRQPWRICKTKELGAKKTNEDEDEVLPDGPSRTSTIEGKLEVEEG